MLKPRIFITIGLLLAGLSLFAVLEAYEKKTNVEKNRQVELLFPFLIHFLMETQLQHTNMFGQART